MRKTRMVACLSIAAAGIYLGFLFYSRWRDNQALIQRLKAPVAARDRAIADAYGEDVKIMSFYAVPSTIRRGETARLCYGVVNAETVRIEPPPAESLWPSRSRCVAVMPETDTDYRLVAEDDRGNAKTADVTITIR